MNERDWSHITQCIFRNTPSLVPFSCSNLNVGGILGQKWQKRLFGDQVHPQHKCRWPERSSCSISVLRAKGSYGYQQRLKEWYTQLMRNQTEEVWVDWTGSSAWRKDTGAAAEDQCSEHTNSLEDHDRWFNVETGEPYRGMGLDYQGRPKPEGQQQNPWQWRKGQRALDCVIDPHGHMCAEFRGKRNWQLWVRGIMCQILEEASKQIYEGEIVFRGVNDDDVRCNVTPVSKLCSCGHATPRLQHFSGCIGVDEYMHLTPLRHCCHGATAFAEMFCEAGGGSHGISITSDTATLGTKDDFKWEIQKLVKVIKAQGSHLQVVAIYLACHAMQIGAELWLVPRDAKITTEDFEDNVTQRCFKLSDIVEQIVRAVDMTKRKALNSERCLCLFIADTCRESFGQASQPGDMKHGLEDLNSRVGSGGSVCDCAFFFSTTPGSTASDGRKLEDHSPYTQVLLDEFFIPGRSLNAIQLALERKSKQASHQASVSTMMTQVFPCTQPVLDPAPEEGECITEDMARMQEIQEAHVEDKAIVFRKLRDPTIELPLDEKLRCLRGCLRMGELAAQKAANQHALIVIGNTGAGKSTFVNYLHGCFLERAKLHDGKNVIQVIPDSVPPELMAIGQTKLSATFIPEVEAATLTD